MFSPPQNKPSGKGLYIIMKEEQLIVLICGVPIVRQARGKAEPRFYDEESVQTWNRQGTQQLA